MALTAPQVSQLLLFTIEDSLFCCPSSQVLTLIAPPPLTRIPFMPDFARGAFDYQGHTASVISLRHKLHFTDAQDRTDGVVLLSPLGQRIAGFWIDAVDEVVDVDQIKWLVMPEGFQDAVFSHAIQYQGRTAFYLDLNLLWTHQEETLINIHQLPQGEQLQVLEVLPDVNESPHTLEVDIEQAFTSEPLPTENAPEPLVTADDDKPDFDEASEGEVQTAPVSQVDEEISSNVESVWFDEGPIRSPGEETVEAYDDHEPDYKVAASSVAQIEEYRESVAEPANTVLHSVLSEELGELDEKPRRRGIGLWLVALLLLLFLPGGFFFYQQQDHKAESLSQKPEVTTPPPTKVEEEKITVDEETSIRIQKQALVNPPPYVKQHVVVRGDTLWDISSRYLNNPWLYPELARRSEIINPNRIYPGDVVIIYRRREGTDKH